MKKINLIFMIASILVPAISKAKINYGDEFTCSAFIENYNANISIDVVAPKVPYRSHGIVSYVINIWGHSRVHYSAEYFSDIEPSSTRIGFEYNLIKSNDNSTWKDMPEEITLYSYFYDYLLKATFPNLGFVSVNLCGE